MGKTDCDSNSESDSGKCTMPKRSKYSGSFKYKTKFSKEWMKTWPFISGVHGSPYHFRCNLCAKTIYCGHQGSAQVRDHASCQGHIKQAKAAEMQPKLSFQQASPLDDKVLNNF